MSTKLGQQPWQAQWIAPAYSVSIPTSNLWLCYRKSFMLEQLPATAAARIAVDSKYWLWLNGKPVIIEGQLQRKEGTANVLAEHFRLLPVPHAMQAPESHNFG